MNQQLTDNEVITEANTKQTADKDNGLAASKIRIVSWYALTLRLLMSYIYMEHLFLMFLDHTQRRSTVGRTPLDE